MDDVTKQTILSGVRSILIAVGTILATKGIIDEGQWSIIVGALMAIIPAVWGIYDKIQSERKTNARENVAVNAGITFADSTDGQTPLIPASDTKAVIENFAPVVPPTPGATL